VPGSRPKSGSFSSSGRSESSAGGAGGASSGNETEEGEVKARHLLVANHGGSNGQRVLVKIRPPQLPPGAAHRHREASCSTDGRQSSDDDDDDDDDDDEEGDSNSSAASRETDTSPPAAGSLDGNIPQSGGNLKMRIVAPDRRRVISRPCVPRGSVAHGKADLFPPHLPRLTPKSGKYGGSGSKLARQRKQLTPEDDEEAAAMSDSEDSITQQIKMKVCR